MANSIEVERLRGSLGVARGSLVDRWIATAFDYFHDVLHVDPLHPDHLKYLRGIDFHRPVTTERLLPGTLLVRFPAIVGGIIQREQPKPYRFFAMPGATPAHLGWNPDETAFQLHQLRQVAPALMSFASAIRFGDTRSRLGGDRQVVIPWHTSIALLRQRDFDRHKLAEMFRAGYLPLGLS